MIDLVKVGMADLKTVRHPGGLTTLGLGSCIGVCLYDPATKITGMAHIMLPSSKAIKNNSNEAKFADTAIVKLIAEMVSMGASNSRLVGKMAGGAQMFAFSGQNDMMRIGERNAAAVREMLNSYGIRILADDTGGNFGRSIEFYSEDGKLLIKTIGHGTKTL